MGIIARFAELGRRIEHEKGAKAAVRLLKASYLVGLYKKGKRLVRRQELPEAGAVRRRARHRSPPMGLRGLAWPIGIGIITT